MMQLCRCDQCGNEISEHAMCRYTLERHGIDVPSFGEDPSPKDFCSLVCVARWAETPLSRVPTAAEAANGLHAALQGLRP